MLVLSRRTARVNRSGQGLVTAHTVNFCKCSTWVGSKHGYLNKRPRIVVQLWLSEKCIKEYWAGNTDPVVRYQLNQNSPVGPIVANSSPIASGRIVIDEQLCMGIVESSKIGGELLLISDLPNREENLEREAPLALEIAARA